MNELYADVIIDISHEALDKVFQYRVPLSLREQIITGSQVIVPFGKGNRATKGYVIELKSEADYDKSKIKEIFSVVPGGVCVESQLIQVASFLKYQYGSSMARALRTVLPVKAKIKRKERVTLRLLIGREQAEEYLDLWQRRHYTAMASLMERLLQKDEITKEEAIKECKVPLKKIRDLEQKGLISMSTSVVYRNPFEGLKMAEKKILLNEQQRQLHEEFCEDYRQGIRHTYLLYGVTGSGKTEVYIALIEEMIAQKKQSIVLIPEISLTFQTVKRFYERFGDRIAVLHSKMSAGEKSDAAERARLGDADVIIGARSALFAPAKNLGLIIIDEEHDSAYKSDTSPKYHARETAIYRAGLAGASVVLGSATPSVESYARALRGEYILWRLDKRPGNARLPDVSVVNLKEEFARGNRSIFSEVLEEKIRERLKKKEQIILFLNRRGFAGFVSCRSCGKAVKCPHCDVTLTYHRNGKLKCHYCGYEIPYVKKCPYCKSNYVAAFGLGTEKVEAALLQLFPGVSVLRMDADTTRKKHGHEKILETFSKGEADILIGTQMIVKGHDYANVTLVGILAADLSLYGQDYRSGENTFQLLCQAAGRAGRGEKTGEVVIQTYSPEHYAITQAANQSYEGFFQEEYAYRKMMGYPPCGHMLVILIQSSDEKECILGQMRIQKIIEKSQYGEEEAVQILNPGKAAIGKIKDIHRSVLYLKHKEEKKLLKLKERLEPVLLHHEMFAGLQIQFDYDPMSFY